MALAFDVRVGDLNWLFLVYAVAVVVVILCYLFYFGRLLAGIVSVVLRAILWRRWRAWIDIGSLQFSPLGGRLLFRDVRYVGENQTIEIAMGHITWRYWLWRVRQDDDLRREDSRLPCRTSIKLEGAEWFIYNRNAAFDMLLERLGRREANATQGGSSDSEAKEKGSVRILPPSNENHMQLDPDAVDWFRESLPLELNVVKGAIVMGNRSTPSLVVAGFHSAVGTCGAVKSRSANDFYKQIYQFTFAKPRILFRKNHDYDEPLLQHGIQMRKEKASAVGFDIRPASQTLHRSAFSELLRHWPAFANLLYQPKAPAASKEPEVPEWHGLSRYREAVAGLGDLKVAELHDDKQYGKVSTIYDNGDSIDLTYYADVAGYVPSLPFSFGKGLSSAPDLPDIGNGDLSPEWGVDIRLNGGTLTYGPWADRQRTAIQGAFFPPAFFNTEATGMLQPGDRRLHTALKIFLDFSQTTTFRLPTRESSKDWKYDGRDPTVEAARRPYGWLDMALGPDSSVTFVLPMIATSEGYETFLEVHLDSLTIYSSVNYEKFLDAKSCRISCQLPQPLAWDALRAWKIKVALEKPEVFFLRDHAYLLTDMVRDWTSGEASDFDHFAPFTYEIDLCFTDYALSLYLNERNIVNNAANPEDNTLLTLTGPKVSINVFIPSNTYKPLYSTITSQIEATQIALAMSTPASNTHQAWLTSRTATFGKVDSLAVTLTHTVFSEPGPENVETLDVDLEMDGVLFEALGWIVKYIIELKDNYFGAFNHFTTSAEVEMEKNKVRNNVLPSHLHRKFELSTPDTFEVNLNVVSKNGVLLLPQEVHDCKSGLAVVLPNVGAHLRNHDFYMEMLVDIDPMEMMLCDDFEGVIFDRTIPPASSSNRILVDGLTVSAHRLFGLQPLTSTYVAMWRFTLGDVTGDLAIPHFAALQRIARAFGSNFSDLDNRLPPLPDQSALPDVTFLGASIGAINLNVWSLESAVNLAAPQGFRIHFDDHIRGSRLANVEMRAPLLQARGLVKASKDEWVEVASCGADVVARAYITGDDWQAKATAQRSFLAEQDSLTSRCPFLYSDDIRGSNHGHGSNLYNHTLGSTADWTDFLDINHPDSTDYAEHVYKSKRATGESTGYDKTNRDLPDRSHPLFTYGRLLRTYRLVPASAKGTSRCASFHSQEKRKDDDATLFPSQPRHAMPAYTTPNSQEHATIVGLFGEKPLILFCTPKAVTIAEDIVACLEKNYEPEHWIDELDDLYRKTLPVETTPGRHETFIASFRFPSLELSLVQDVLRPGDLDLPPALESDLPPDASILSIAQITVKDIDIAATFTHAYVLADASIPAAITRHNPSIAYRTAGGSAIVPVTQRKDLGLSVGRSRLMVRHLSPTHDTTSTRTQIPGLPKTSVSGSVLELYINGMSCAAELPDQFQRFAVKIMDVSLDTVSSAAELVTGIVHSWFIVSRKIEQAVLQAHYRPVSSYRRLVTDILQLAHREGIVSDPLFLNRPTAAAVHLRSNVDWKVLAHIRHVLRMLSRRSLQRLQTADSTGIDAVSDFREIVSRLQEWHNWELDEIVIRRIGLVKLLFLPEELPLQDPNERKALNGDEQIPEGFHTLTDVEATVDTGQFAVSYYEEGHCTNKLILMPCHLYAVHNTQRSDTSALRVDIGPLLVDLDPGLLRLIVHVSRVRKIFGRKLAPLLPKPTTAHGGNDAPVPTCSTRNIPMEVTILSRSIDIVTRASGVRASIALLGLHGHAATSLCAGENTSATSESLVFLGCDSLKMLAVLEAKSDRLNEAAGTLISIQLEEISTQTVYDVRSSSSPQQLHTLLAIGSSRIRIPRSILRMSQFLDEWRAESLPESKMAIEALRGDVEKEQEHDQATPLEGQGIATDSPTSPPLCISLHVHVPVINFHIRAAQKFWLDYTVKVARLQSRGVQHGGILRGAQMGFNIDSQCINFIAVNDSQLQGDGAPFGGELIQLPAVFLSAKYTGTEIELLATLEKISLVVTANILDSALTVQKRFERDIDEILAVFAKHKARKAKGSQNSHETNVLERLTLTGQLVLRGINIGLKGPASTQYIGADLLEGQMTHNPTLKEMSTGWEANVSNLALSLAQDNSPDVPLAHGAAGLARSFDRSYRLAYFVLDVSAGNRVAEVAELEELTSKDLANGSVTSHLHVRIGKVHAVMQTAAIEALDDLLEHFVSEIAHHRQVKSEELQAIKEKVISTFEITEPRPGPRVLPWIERCVLSVRINEVGIAIPLQDVEIEAAFFGHPLKADTRAKPAFLVSTPSLLFATSKGSAGIASITDLSAQFVEAFDQTRARDFAGYHHDTRNRLLLPMTGVKIASDAATASKSKAFNVSAKMSGAQLDIDGSIVSYALSLVDLYEIGYKRLGRYAPEPFKPDRTKPDYIPDEVVNQNDTSFIDTTTLEATFEVEIGVVRMHSKPPADDVLPQKESATDGKHAGSNTKDYRPRRRKEGVFESEFNSVHSKAGAQAVQPDSFMVPKLTMWAVKKANAKAGQASILHVDALIHSSRNTLRPTLLPFLSEISEGLKAHMHRQSHQEMLESPTQQAQNSIDASTSPAANVINPNQPSEVPTPASSLRNLCISVSLRIDKSNLQLYCGPIAPVSAGLDWESGGLMLVIQPGARSIHASVRVDEVGFEIKHAYSPERCITGKATKLLLAFSWVSSLPVDTRMSVNFDASAIKGEVNFRQLQDFLCFKAVWLDRLEQLVPVADEPGKVPQVPVEPAIKASSGSITTIVLARIQEIKFTCMLGHNIGTIDLKASMLVGRLRQIPKHSRSLSVDLSKLEIASIGRLAGHLSNEGLYFETYLHDVHHTHQSELRNCTSISASIGHTDASLEFDYRKTLLMRSEPIKLGVSDDWTKIHSEHELGLDFFLRFGTFNMVATTQTVPTLVRLAKDVEKLVNERREKTLAVLLEHKAAIKPVKQMIARKVQQPDMNGSLKAGSVLPSAIPEGTRVVGKIELEADRLSIAVFLHHFTDHEAFRADAGGVSAVLSRVLDEERVVKRELDLHLGFLSVRKLRPKQRVFPAQEQEKTPAEWFDLLRTAGERNIVKFPTSHAEMSSTETEGSNRIYHRFSLVFTGQVDISLNYALLKQLGALLAAYKEGMHRIDEEDFDRTDDKQRLSDAPVQTLETGIESDIEGPAKRVSGANLPPLQSVDKVGSREYIALENNIQQPQLQLLGEATPPLEWLGLQRSHTPALVHEGVTLILESALLELSAVYRKSLSKAVHLN